MLITNLVNKIIAENFVQFIDGQLVFKEGVIDIAADPGGAGGPTMVPVVAYASDPAGTGFSLTPSAALQYVAIAVLSSNVVPAVTDFTGKWLKWKGDPGADGTGAAGVNGEPGGIRMNYSNIILEQKPGTGKIQFNNLNIALATEMYIDDAMPSGVDLSGFWNVLGDGWYCMVKPNTNLNSPLAVIKFTGAVVDNGDWISIPMQTLSMSSATFADTDKLVLQFYGGGGASAAVNEAAILAAGNFMRHASNGAGGYKMLDKTNVEIKAASQTFKFPGFTISGVPNLPAANTFPHNSCVRIHQDCFVGAGSNSGGIFLCADAVNNKWRPFGPQEMFWKEFSTLAGSVANPLNTLTAVGKWNLGTGGDPVIPAGLLNSDSRVRLYLAYRKVGVTAPVVRANLGTDLAARENNSIVYVQTVSTTDNFDVHAESLISFFESTSARCSNRAARGGSGGGGGIIDASTLINVASDMKLTIEASTVPASTSIHLLGYGLVLEG